MFSTLWNLNLVAKHDFQDNCLPPFLLWAFCVAMFLYLYNSWHKYFHLFAMFLTKICFLVDELLLLLLWCVDSRPFAVRRAWNWTCQNWVDRAHIMPILWTHFGQLSPNWISTLRLIENLNEKFSLMVKRFGKLKCMEVSGWGGRRPNLYEIKLEFARMAPCTCAYCWWQINND